MEPINKIVTQKIAKPIRKQVYKLRNAQSQTSKALTEALVLAITASTNADSRRAVWLAGELASRLQASEVAECQAQAKRILNLANDK